MTLVPYDLSGGAGAITVVTSDATPEDVRANRLLSGRDGRLFDDCLAEAGLTRGRLNVLAVTRHRAAVFAAHPRDELDAEIRELHATLRRLKPRVIVTLGAEAAHAVVPEWPDARREGRLTHLGDVKRATDIESRRGYVFDSPFGAVVATVHPWMVGKTWVPWRMLLSYDLQRASEIARDGLVRPTRDVEIIGSTHASRRAVDALRRAGSFSCDIETRSDLSLACVGFAGESGKAYVFPAQFLDGAKALLGDAGLTAIFANGIYDLFVLRHREGWEVRARVEDVQIAWHAAYAELAGAKEDKRRGHRFTRKSLGFLASMFTFDKYWKGDYNDEQSFLEYNGKDCAITFDVWGKLQGTLNDLGARATYEHERSLMWPCVDMLARGLRVNDALRRERIEQLSIRFAEVEAEANKVVLPLLEREQLRLKELEVEHLFEETDGVCPCCRHAAKKQRRCWSCAGFDHAPSKKELLARFPLCDSKATKDEIESSYLTICAVCRGVSRQVRRVVNLNSDTQQKIVLYEVLKLPKRYERNGAGKSVLKSDEATLKSLLGGLPV